MTIKVVLCVCTHNRPEKLERLLHRVALLAHDVKLEIVVVENSATASGIRTCENAQSSGYPWPLTCVREPRPGIPYARNRAVEIALRREPCFIAMLDDDEWPGRYWLKELLRVQQTTACDVVGGPVLPHFRRPPPPWLTRAGLLHGPRHDDLAEVLLKATGSFLGKRECFARLSPRPFNPAYALSGGSDSEFFGRLRLAGFRMSWAARALAYETQEESRFRLNWHLRRWFRYGNTSYITERSLASGIAARSLPIFRTLAFALYALSRLSVNCLRGRSRCAAALARVSFACGRIAAIFGYRLREYA